MKSYIKDIVKDSRIKSIPHYYALANYEYIEKIFPEYNLGNCSKDIFYRVPNPQLNNLATDLIDYIGTTVANRCDNLDMWMANRKLSSKRKIACINIINLCNSLHYICDNNLWYLSNKCEIFSKYKCNISKYKCNSIAKETNLIHLYDKINKLLIDNKLLKMPKLSQKLVYTKFNAASIVKDRKSYTLHFSSTGADGIWDISTMSMRAVWSSCQSWGKPQSECLLGSIIDPFTAIMYLTDNTKTHFGSKMIYRSIVRFVINENTQRPFLYIEKCYPNKDISNFDEIADTFKQFLQDRVKRKIAVKDFRDLDTIDQCYIPYTPNTRNLLSHQQSYRDSGIEYSSATIKPDSKAKYVKYL